MNASPRVAMVNDDGFVMVDVPGKPGTYAGMLTHPTGTPTHPTGTITPP